MAAYDFERASATEQPANHFLVLLAILFPLALLVLRARTTPDPRGFGTHEQLGLPACPVRELLDVRCPGCGATTALSLFARGSFGGSARTHPFAFLCALAGSLLAPVVLVDRLCGRDPAARLAHVSPRAVVLVAAGICVLSWAWTLASGLAT